MKYLLFLLIILVSCNDGGSDPQDFVQKNKTDSLKLDSLKKTNTYPYTVK